MTRGALVRRYFLLAVLGTLCTVAAVPGLRIGIIELTLVTHVRLLDRALPGPALCRLLRVAPWSADYPALRDRLRAATIRCYVRLGDFGSAVLLARDTAAPESPAGIVNLARGLLLRYPNEAANLLLACLGRDRGVTRDTLTIILREELERANTDAARAILATLTPPRADDAEDAGPSVAAVVPPPAVFAAEPSAAPGYATPPPELPPVSQPPPEPLESTPPPVVPDGAQWAVVTAPEARTYTREGKFIGRIEAGTLVDLGEVTASSAGDLALCVVRNGTQQGQSFNIRAEDLDIRPGSVSATSEEERNLRVSRARLAAALAERQSQLRAMQESRNPHLRAYTKVKEEYVAFVKEAKGLAELHESSQGATRVKHADRLRRMKEDEVELAARYKEAKARYDEWQTEHGTAIDLTGDSEVQRIVAKKAELDARLERMN